MKFKGVVDLLLAQNLRGHVDVYPWNGLRVARSWPHPTSKSRSAAQAQTRTNMRLAMIWAWRPYDMYSKPASEL